jgi:hypothetical protein
MSFERDGAQAAGGQGTRVTASGYDSYGIAAVICAWRIDPAR